MLSVHFSLNDEEDDKYESVNNYEQLFEEYINKSPSLDEALDQLFESKGITDENLIKTYKDEIFNKCKSLYEKNKIKEKYPKINEDDFNIICSYTCEITQKDFSPFIILNKSLMSENGKSGIEKVTKYYYLLLTTLRKLEKKEYDILYRAIPNKIELEKGKTKTFWGFTSASTSFLEDQILMKPKLISKTYTIYQIKNALGYDISLFHCLYEGNEGKEILLEPEEKYEIEDITSWKKKKNKLQIYCNFKESQDVLTNIFKNKEEKKLTKTSDDNKGNIPEEESKKKEVDDKSENFKKFNCLKLFGFLSIFILLSISSAMPKFYHYYFDSKTIIGIDFGHSFSGFAVLESNNDKRFDFSEAESRSDIIPSKIIIDRTEYSAITIPINKLKIDNLASENKLLFYNFKKNLDPRNYKAVIESNLPMNSKVPLEKVIQAYFEKFKKNYIDENKKIQETELKEIKWVITIPPLYDDRSKALMKKIACKTLLNQNSCKNVNDQIQLALEPEAASLAIIYDKKIGHFFSKGINFLLVDAGGFTVDFSLNKIIDKEYNLKQLKIPKSFVFGSNLINEKIVEIIELIFKKDKIDFIRNNYYSQWTSVLDEIEEIKKIIDQIEGDNIKFSVKLDIDPKNCWKCWFYNLWTDCMCEIDYNNSTFSYNKTNIFIPKEYIRNIIINLAYNITKEIKNYCNENLINLIAITGGFSYNNILRELIETELSDYSKKNKVIFLDSPQETVMKGAAIYGIKKSQIKERILPISIGVKSYEKCNKEECVKYIQKFKMGDTVKTDKPETITNVYPKLDKFATIEFYYSYSDNIRENGKHLKTIQLYSIKKEKKTIQIKFSNYISIKVDDPEEGDEWVIVDYP